MGFERFDTSRLDVKPLEQRVHDMVLTDVSPLRRPQESFDCPEVETVANRVKRAREKGAPVIALMGAHVIKTGMSRYIIDLMERGFLTHVGFNGACAIHDFELALIGATTESVARYISEGQFGLWKETGKINDIAREAASQDLGLGEALGKWIAEKPLPHKEVSILAAGYRLRVPVTVHVAIGQDITHEHPNCDGAALGLSSYRDFLVFANSVEKLEGGVFLNIGTAVMGPEVFLKALAMARNVARQQGRQIDHFTTAVFDLQPIRSHEREPGKSSPEYYFRFLKTVLVRTVKNGGESFYVQGDHRKTIPTLWYHLVGKE